MCNWVYTLHPCLLVRGWIKAWTMERQDSSQARKLSGSVRLQRFTKYIYPAQLWEKHPGHFSAPQPVDISVIQGNLLWPILNLVNIGNFPNYTTPSSFLFADDTSLFKSGKDLTEVHNSELVKVVSWYRANKMAINTDKTKNSIFHLRGKDYAEIVFDHKEQNTPQNPASIHTLKESVLINQTPHLDQINCLVLYMHILLLSIKSLPGDFSFLRRKIIYLIEYLLCTLYYSLFHCHTLYCLIILTTTSQSSQKLLLCSKKLLK
jgi:hypothetical protein